MAARSSQGGAADGFFHAYTTTIVSRSQHYQIIGQLSHLSTIYLLLKYYSIVIIDLLSFGTHHRGYISHTWHHGLLYS
jgi:hypothetical protein